MYSSSVIMVTIDMPLLFCNKKKLHRISPQNLLISFMHANFGYDHKTFPTLTY